MEEEELAGIVTVLILLLLVVVIIILFVAFLKRKNKLIQEQEEARLAYEKELSEVQIEIREETLRNISWELHDNIGQLMTLAKIQVQLGKEKPEGLEEAADTIGKGIDELRTLSKSINPEALKSLNLRDAVGLEISRFNRMGFITATLRISGESFSLGAENELIVFRILQEFFSNTIKHSRASELAVHLAYKEDVLLINALDNGVGFSDSADFSGIGMRNMKNRAKFINAQLQISSTPEHGTKLRLQCPKETKD
mgnify:CR=1 FL=1